jgi:hypothetical protein
MDYGYGEHVAVMRVEMGGGDCSAVRMVVRMK